MGIDSFSSSSSSSSSLLVEGGDEGDHGCTPADNGQVNIQVLRWHFMQNNCNQQYLNGGINPHNSQSLFQTYHLGMYHHPNAGQ